MKKVVAVQDHADYKSDESYRPKSSSGMIIVAAVAALLIGGAGGFFVGFQVAGGGNANTNDQANQQEGMSGGPGGMMGGGRFGMGGIGTVTAIDETSITIEDQRQNEETVYAINSETEVTDDESAASVSDIKVGDTVMVQSDDSDSENKTATTIRLNPSFGGGPNSTMQSSWPNSYSSNNQNI